MSAGQAARRSDLGSRERPHAHLVAPGRARWGRAGMASFFVVGAAVSFAIHEDSWSRIASGNANPLDWLYAIGSAAGALTGVLFAVGRATVGIAVAWISYCLMEAIVAYPFWAVPADAVAESASGFLAHLAVAASLMLYISVAGDRR